jgi:hypothetical protein
VKKFQELTENEISTLEKGTITINTLNRIENKQDELTNLMNNIGYWNTQITNKEWDYSKIFNENDLQRIIENTDILREAFFVLAETPKTPSASYYFENINALEKILHDIEAMVSDIKVNYRECGILECGES